MNLHLHAPVQGATDAFWATARALGATGYVWLAFDTNGPHRPQDALRDPGATHLVRIPTILQGETLNQYLARVDAATTAWRAAVPGAWFVPGNEPDIPAGNDVPAAWDGQEWTWKAVQVAATLRRQYPGIRLACPAFSVERTNLLSPPLAAAFDAITAHCYWEGTVPSWRDDATENPGLGQAWRHAAAIAAGKPLFVTEVNAVHTDEAIAAARDPDGHAPPPRPEQLASWLATLDGRVNGAAFFIADADQYWPDHPFTEAHAAAVRLLVANPADPVDNGGTKVDERALIAAVAAKTEDPVLRAALLMGPALETGTITAPWPDQQGGGPARGPYQIEAGPGGWHYGRISEEDARDPAKALDYMFPSYEAAYRAVPRLSEDTAHYLAAIVAAAERPAAFIAGNVYGYPEDRIVRAYALISAEAGLPTPADAQTPDSGDPGAKSPVFVTPVDAPIYQGSMGTYSHAGSKQDEGIPDTHFYAIDYAPLPLFSPIRAVADGVVDYDAFDHPFEGRTGNTLCVAHTGDAAGYESRYCHLTEKLVHQGDTVRQGQIIAKSGAPNYPYPGANGYGSGAHLHFSIVRGGGGNWVKVEDLMAAGLMVAWAEARKGPAMFSTDTVDEGLVELAWTSQGVKLNPTAGIFQDWRQKVYVEGRVIGVPITEETDVGWGIVQVFSTGVVASWNANDNRVRWHGHLAAA